MTAVRWTEEQYAEAVRRRQNGCRAVLLPTLNPKIKIALSSMSTAAFDPSLPGEPSKYRNRKTEIDGLTFASKREGRRYVELKNMQLAGQITDLRMQVEIPCIVNEQQICTYVADFSYRNADRVIAFMQGTIYEDAKGARTDVYKLKRKLVRACTSIEIVEV